MGRIPDRVRELIYKRDGGRCPHCGATEGLGLQHRISKGMGGSKLLDTPANLLTFCNTGNSDLEADPEFAELGRRNGWKLSRWDDPLTTPVHDINTGHSWLHNNSYGRERAI